MSFQQYKPPIFPSADARSAGEYALLSIHQSNPGSFDASSFQRQTTNPSGSLDNFYHYGSPYGISQVGSALCSSSSDPTRANVGFNTSAQLRLYNYQQYYYPTTSRSQTPFYHPPTLQHAQQLSISPEEQTLAEINYSQDLRLHEQHLLGSNNELQAFTRTDESVEILNVSQPSTSAESCAIITSTKKAKAHKFCEICGDIAKSFHFGGLSCDSCKAFFRRSVHGDSFKQFFCSYDRKCKIRMESRKACQFCRFNKCLSIGMETSWVMSNDDREKLSQSRLRNQSRKRRGESGEEATSPGDQGSQPCLHPNEPDERDKDKYMSREEQRDIDVVVSAYAQCYQQMPYEAQDPDLTTPHGTSKQQNNNNRIISMFSTIVKRMFMYSRMLPGFNEIPVSDQAILLRGGVLEMCLLRGAMVFDVQKGQWPSSSMDLYRNNCPTLHVDHVRKCVSSELFQQHMDFIRGVQEMKPDESTIMLLSAIALICPDRVGLSATQPVARLQERYLHLLKQYMMWRYGARNARVTYPKLLMKLVDLQLIYDNRTDSNILLNKDDTEELRISLASLSLDPFPLRQKSDSSSSPTDPDGIPERPTGTVSTVDSSAGFRNYEDNPNNIITYLHTHGEIPAENSHEVEFLHHQQQQQQQPCQFPRPEAPRIPACDSGLVHEWFTCLNRSEDYSLLNDLPSTSSKGSHNARVTQSEIQQFKQMVDRFTSASGCEESVLHALRAQVDPEMLGMIQAQLQRLDNNTSSRLNDSMSSAADSNVQ